MTQDKEDTMNERIRKAIMLCAPVVILMLACPASLAVEAADNFQPPVLRDVMWQVLPDNIRSVFVGPDKRIWWQIDHGREKPDVADIQEIIEGRFGSEAPEIYGARIALFEPGGRVWFIDHSGKYLLGYDGERWLERQAPGRNSFCGSSPNHGRYARKGYNLVVRGKAFFPSTDGVHCFDLETETWFYVPIPGYKFPGVFLMPEPDGKGLIACFNGIVDSRANPTEYSVIMWRWREDNWTLPIPEGISKTKVAGIVPVKKGVWIDEQYQRGGVPETRLWFISYAPETDAQETQPPFTLGPYSAGEVALKNYDGSGSSYFGAKEILKEGKSLGPGMLVHQADGKVTALLGKQFVGLPRHDYRCGGSGPLAVPGRNAVWDPRWTVTHQEPLLVSLQTGDVMATMPDHKFGWLHSALDDGTVFASITEPGQANDTIAVCKPDAPDTRTVLESQQIEIKRNVFCIASDGAIWAAVPDPDDPTRGTQKRSTIVRFDGKKWEPVEAFKGFANASRLIPGRNAEILAIGRSECRFIAGDEIYRDNDLQALIAGHKKAFASAFLMGSSGGNNGRGKIVADKGGNIWLNGPLKVLISDTWVDAKPSLRAAGSREGEVVQITAIGDSGMVYLTDFTSAWEGGTSFYGEVVGGDLVFTPAPACNVTRSARRRTISHDNALCVPVQVPKVDRRGANAGHGQEVYLVAGDFAPKRLTDAGWPMLCDKSGNMWLGQVAGKERNLYNIYAHGELAHTLAIPSVSYTPVWPISDRPGSVFARTSTGIYHLTAEEPDQPAKYTIKKRYDDTSIMAEWTSWVGYSSLGYIVMYAQGTHPGWALYLIKLPQPEEE